MNIKHARRILAGTVAAAALAAMAQPGSAIAAGEADASATRAGASATTLFVEDPEGNAFRLIRVDGVGWKYASGWPATQSKSMFRKVALGSTGEPQPKAADVPADEPLTVFIDGPSGFTYVWNRDGGWTFVGKLASRQP